MFVGRELCQMDAKWQLSFLEHTTPIANRFKVVKDIDFVVPSKNYINTSLFGYLLTQVVSLRIMPESLRTVIILTTTCMIHTKTHN